MSEERLQILNMLAEGKITAEDAERLLNKIETLKASESVPVAEDARPIPPEPPTPRRKPKFLHVHVDGDSGEHVNIRVPLALIRTGIKLSTVLPSDANEKLSEKGINLADLNGMDTEELIEALRELTVEVDRDDGESVRIYCE